MTATCSLPDCSDRRYAKGFCKRHYQQQWATGSPAIRRPNPHGPPEERFWRYVDVRSAGECWTWNGHRDKDGYGTLRVGRTQMRAHRFSYELHNGPIPDGELVRHACDNPPCCNPSHLGLGDHVDNMRDRVASGHYATGEAHPMARLTDAQAAEVRVAVGPYVEIAERFGISASQVGNIKRGAQRAASVPT